MLFIPISGNEASTIFVVDSLASQPKASSSKFPN